MKSEIDLELIDIQTFADLVRTSTRHIERLDATEQIPAPVRLGRSKRWRLLEIKAWLEAGCPHRDEWVRSREASRTRRTEARGAAK